MWDRLIDKEVLSPRTNPASSTETWFSCQLDIYPMILFLNPVPLRKFHKSAFSFYIILFLCHGYGDNPPSPSWSFFLPSSPLSFIIIINCYYMLTNKVTGLMKGFLHVCIIIWEFHTMHPNHIHFPFLPGSAPHLCALSLPKENIHQVQFPLPVYSLEHGHTPSGKPFKDNRVVPHPFQDSSTVKTYNSASLL